VFHDRKGAGQTLGVELQNLAEKPSIVLGVPRGGVIVAAEVALVLDAVLDVVVPRKLGAPGNPELGIGAVARGVRVIDRSMVRRLRVSDDYLDAEAARQTEEMERRMVAYRGERPFPDLRGATVAVVDDGVATGATAIAALRWVRAEGAARVVFAAPVGPPAVVRRLSRECDECILLLTPADLRAVGQWYEMFDQTTDDEVRAALSATR
jgi:putative phosphoribosyl transferase